MDHRLRPEYDAVPTPQHYDHSGSGQVVYRPSVATHAVDDAVDRWAWSATPIAANPLQRVAVPDVRVFHAEISRLRQLLASAQAHHAQQNLQIQQASRFSAQNDALKRQLAELSHRAELEKEQLKEELSQLRTQHESEKKSRVAQANQVEALKRELSNVAIAASAEQQAFKGHHQSVVSRKDAVIREKDRWIERLRSQLDENNQRLEQWQHAHANAVTLCELYDRERRSDDDRFAALQDEHDRFKERVSEGFALCEEEIEMLENTIVILRTDHEAVELTNADLDHRNDEFESALYELQSDLESVMVHASRDRQESRRAIETLQQQFHATNIRLIAASEEKKSLVESLAKLKKVADDFDASLFAKDQEINATKRLVDESQRQIQQLRREHAVLGGQNEEMRNRIRTLTGDVSELQARLAESEAQVSRAEETLAERDRQMREIQSAARAAEANATLRASEAEQQYAIELDRLESAMEHQNESQSHATQIESDYRTRIDELESKLAASQHAAAVSSAEKDRLQETVDQQGSRVGELRSTVEEKSHRIDLLEDTLAQLQSEISAGSQSAQQISHDLDQRRTQLAEFADRIATQQHLIEVRDQELAEANRQLAVHNSPINEVKRLSKELSRRIGDHARERAVLLERIEQLGTSAQVNRAA